MCPTHCVCLCPGLQNLTNLVARLKVPEDAEREKKARMASLSAMLDEDVEVRRAEFGALCDKVLGTKDVAILVG